MIDGIQFEEGLYGKRAVATSAWAQQTTDYLLRNGIKELELNAAKGWKGSDLSFLAKLPALNSLKIIDFQISSVGPIHSLRELRHLEVSTYCQTEIKFSAFPQLQECALEWRSGARSLFDCLTLKRLFVNRYDGRDAKPFAQLASLESLAILNAPLENIQGLGSLGNLRTLRLANLKRLTSLTGVEHLENLEELDVNTCRAIGSIEQLSALSRLKSLNLNNVGAVESLKPLEHLSNLESVVFYESTNILDGDLSPLLDRKRLTRVSFQDRRHYSHRREEFGPAYAG